VDDLIVFSIFVNLCQYFVPPFIQFSFKQENITTKNNFLLPHEKTDGNSIINGLCDPIQAN